ncbi:outer membrane beta-barrel protein [Fulvivirgaceae bacterium BMA12]|uniref:Outer membrane beta-barrel protein n=1 Tax=Agaribacillus aureus TaxID=3051825 RepID=A0ABT8KZT4_9BACT|nr:outer membrane beta-barrel protein [Fulvivirgaceae bacterium BMA12]
MKKLTLLAITLMISSLSYGQFFTLGPKIGFSSSKLKLSDNIDAIKEKDAQLGFHAGLFTRFSLGGFYVQPEALFTSVDGQVQINEGGSSPSNQIVDLEYNKLDVPVMFGTTFLKIFRLQAGPTASLLLSADAKSSLSGVKEDVKSSYKDATLGYQLGFGVDISRLVIDLKWEGNLSSFGDDLSLFGQTFQTDQRNRLLTLSVGFKLIN